MHVSRACREHGKIMTRSWHALATFLPCPCHAPCHGLATLLPCVFAMLLPCYCPVVLAMARAWQDHVTRQGHGKIMARACIARAWTGRAWSCHTLARENAWREHGQYMARKVLGRGLSKGLSACVCVPALVTVNVPALVPLNVPMAVVSQNWFPSPSVLAGSLGEHWGTRRVV